jgi:3-oxoacyl-[acyl-carrier protein] reductase
MDLGLKGKKALITGASRGIGYAIALELAREGAQIAINSRHEQTLVAAAKAIQQAVKGESAVIPVVGDVARDGIAAKVVESAAHSLGGLDVLVTSTGGPRSGDFEEITDGEWGEAVNALLMSHVRLVRAALSYLKKSPAAAVVTITSYSVKQPIPRLVLSNSVRAATAALTKTLALELGGEGIRFNSILPGWTATQRVEELMKARAAAKGTRVEEEIAAQGCEIPLGRMAKPEEIAKAAVFLLSPAASYITGVWLNVDGGVYRGLC